MTRNLILIRSLPGSGKTTHAEVLKEYYKELLGCFHIDVCHYEADMYFIDKVTNTYNFDKTKLCAAHRWCQQQTYDALQNDSYVIVSNTFTTKKELLPYFAMAKEFGIIPQVILCQNEYGSVHDVSEITMNKMKQRFEYDISELFQYLKDNPHEKEET